MKIDATEVILSDLLNRGNLVFRVPVYQRPYSWTQEQWEDIWLDVTEQDSGEVHFIGSLVVIKKGAVVAGFDELEVVDGQQRLTTLSILLCAIRDLMRSKGEEDIADRIDKSCLQSSTFKENSRKLFLGKLDDQSYKRLIEGHSEGDGNVRQAYGYFRERLEACQDLQVCAEKVLDGVSLVLIMAENAEDAFKLFETLNDRGLDLSAIDLIKNHILSVVATRFSNDLEGVIETWDGLMTELEGLDKIRFARHFYLSRNSGKISKHELYPIYKKRIDTMVDLPEFTLDFLEASQLYRKIHTGGFDDKQLNRKCEDLLNLRATQSFILLLRLLREGWPVSNILEVIPIIEAFSLRRQICGWSSNEMDTIYNQLAVRGSSALVVEEVRDELQKNCPEDDEFIPKFRDRWFRQDSQTVYVLEQFEYRAVGTKEKRISDRKNVHIEHIMPQKITTKKSKRRHGGDWITYLGDDAGKHADHVGLIGNLTLLAAELNVPASNNPFTAKKSFYGKSDIKIARDLCSYEDWRIEQIIGRSDQMSKMAAEIWSI